IISSLSTTRTWSSTRETLPPRSKIRRRASFRCRPRPDFLVLVLTLGVGARANAQFGLVQLPLDDPAYVQLAALEHMGCAEARVSPRRPYDVRSVRDALTRARNIAACRGPILDALNKRFGNRQADMKAGLRGGGEATVRVTGLTGGEFEPLWNTIR